jgi:hypothetical protein
MYSLRLFRSISNLDPNCLTQLLQRPGGTRMGRDIAIDQAPAAVLDQYAYTGSEE